MTNRSSLHPRLHALIGDIASDVPDDIAREIECALRDASPATDQSLFLAQLQAIRIGDAEDGQTCAAQMLTAPCVASISRSLAALATALELLHADERARVQGQPHEHLGDGHRDGLLFAARQLAQRVRVELHDARCHEQPRT